MSTPYDLSQHNFDDPNPWLALELDQSTFFHPPAKAALLRGQQRRSRRYFLPFIRPLARGMIVLVKLLRSFVPNHLTSSPLLHRSIAWGMRRFVCADANYLILRHFHIGSQILRFIADNVPGVAIRPNPLTPHEIADVKPDMFLVHDLNIYNFIIQLNAQLREQGRQIAPRPLEQMDFSAITEIDSRIAPMPDGALNVLDLQSAIEFYTPLYALFLSDTDFWRASNSLQLDETIAIYVARLFNRESILGLVNNRHPTVPISTLEAGYRLMLHGLDAENLYGFICHMKAVQEGKATV